MGVDRTTLNLIQDEIIKYLSTKPYLNEKLINWGRNLNWSRFLVVQQTQTNAKRQNVIHIIQTPKKI